jgi:predicted nuclease with RNAse H fold
VTALALAVVSLALAVALASLAVSRALYLRAKDATRVVQSFTTPTGVVTFDGPLSGDDFRRFREEFEKRTGAKHLAVLHSPTVDACPNPVEVTPHPGVPREYLCGCDPREHD